MISQMKMKLCSSALAIVWLYMAIGCSFAVRQVLLATFLKICVSNLTFGVPSKRSFHKPRGIFVVECEHWLKERFSN
jgi:hypothetical protein